MMKLPLAARSMAMHRLLLRPAPLRLNASSGSPSRTGRCCPGQSLGSAARRSPTKELLPARQQACSARIISLVRAGPRNNSIELLPLPLQQQPAQEMVVHRDSRTAARRRNSAPPAPTSRSRARRLARTTSLRPHLANADDEPYCPRGCPRRSLLSCRSDQSSLNGAGY